ncbi:hypothetical protein CAPTEDRAFT_180624 [Capitella teleta]|uniref:C2H2-type domain-containing protein n=1 Tax=Capitella teleta TaxID=283909 RepID=R7UA42_CAPTE|nr:hypothetical protein CAPTEDRAFT_180624 [Capitella teleta]|eukprot:ELU03235.1 hypothetical protein CAPTEDRAFT_180624 [Capitella teleta]
MCDEFFTSEVKFIIHYLKNHADSDVVRKAFRCASLPSDGTYECEECGRHCSNWTAYASHRRCHGPDRIFECEKCGFIAKKQGVFNQHMRDKHAPTVSLQCKVCDKEYQSKGSLRTHMRMSHESGVVTCNLCLRKFNHARYLESHIRRFHQQEKNYCGHTFINKSQLTQHENSHTGNKPFKCDVCPKAFFRSSLRKIAKHKKVHSDVKPHRCQLCGKGFKFPYKLTAHMTIHTKEGRHRCPHCLKVFTAYSTLRKHNCKVEGPKKIQCPQCTTKFRNHILLNQHIKQKHLKAYMRMCTHCGKEMQATAYKEHYRVFHGPEAETERRNFICQKCGRLSRTKRAHDRHMETAHTEENPEEEEIARTLVVNENQQSSCRLCGFGAKYAKTVVRHIVQVHAERRYSCELCGAAFAREKFLQRHVDIFHRKLERCSCDQCGRSFQSKQHLKGHVQRMHQPRFQHSCYICGKGFHQKDALEQHL